MHHSTAEIMVPITAFREFDDGKVIEADPPANITVQQGDTLWWVCANYEGTCVIEGINGNRVSIRKK